MRYSQLIFISILFYCFLPAIAFAQKSTDPKKSAPTETINGKKYYLHTVGKEQTLYTISLAYAITVNDLLVENPDAIDTLRVGDVLKIPFMQNKTDAVPQAGDTAKPAEPASKFTFSAYVDAYYAYYTDSVGTGNYNKFPSVAPRSDFGLNTAMISGQYDDSHCRAIISLHYGDIAKSAWSATFNNIMEAHAGIRLFKKLWIDAGFFRTHVGAEGLHPKENFASSVAVCTYYEPYYESGVRLNYNPGEKLAINLFILNGYNIFEENNRKKSVGLLATYAIGDKGSLGYNNYIGDDTPTAGDSIPHLRVYQNLFFNYQAGKFKMQLGVDYAVQENSHISNSFSKASMYSGVLGIKCQAKEKIAFYSRGEVFNDPQGFMSGVFVDKADKFTGQKLWGLTLGLEYKPAENAYVRLEGRQLEMDKDQEIFRYKNGSTNSRLEMIFNMGVSF